MNDSGEVILSVIVALIVGGIGWNVGYDKGMETIKTKVIESQEYVDTLRALDATEKEMKKLEDRLD